jgi:hypothetical protein
VARLEVKQKWLADEAAKQCAELAEELQTALELAARMRLSGEATGSRLATIELGPFQLPNPGRGGALHVVITAAGILHLCVTNLAPGSDNQNTVQLMTARMV